MIRDFVYADNPTDRAGRIIAEDYADVRAAFQITDDRYCALQLTRRCAMNQHALGAIVATGTRCSKMVTLPHTALDPSAYFFATETY
ncbi:hypothetical protein BMS3Bbin04_00438 [bacterium BMS3Bbin04]|nr:hypothetical protein BMS3Bbin04_00438 [bacterium BMS3Bbin04]